MSAPQLEYQLARANGDMMVMNRPASEPVLDLGLEVALAISPADVWVLQA